MSQVSSFWFLDLVALSSAEAGCHGPEERLHTSTYEIDMEQFANPNLSMVVAKCCFLGVCGARQNFLFVRFVFTSTLT